MHPFTVVQIPLTRYPVVQSQTLVPVRVYPARQVLQFVVDMHS